MALEIPWNWNLHTSIRRWIACRHSHWNERFDRNDERIPQHCIANWHSHIMSFAQFWVWKSHFNLNYPRVKHFNRLPFTSITWPQQLHLIFMHFRHMKTDFFAPNDGGPFQLIFWCCFVLCFHDAAISATWCRKNISRSPFPSRFIWFSDDGIYSSKSSILQPIPFPPFFLNECLTENSKIHVFFFLWNGKTEHCNLLYM